MKVTDLAIAFILIILPSTLILDYKTMDTSMAVYENVKMSRVLDAAVEDATDSMFAGGMSEKVSMDIEKGYEGFIHTLYKNFQMIDDELSRRTVEGYIPCLVAIDYDGYYIMKHVEYTRWDGFNNITEIKMVWMPKQSYSYSDAKYIYSLTLGNEITVYDKGTEKIYKDTADNFITNGILTDSELLPDGPDTDEIKLQDFDIRRRNAIVENLQRDIADTINNHNSIAKYYGITYYFSLPTVEHNDWLKTIDDAGFLAFLQGMPMGKSGEYANVFSLGGTRVFKTSKYYLDVDGTPSSSILGGGIFYYHTSEECSYMNPATRPTEGYPARDSAKDCAKEGFFPCEHCN